MRWLRDEQYRTCWEQLALLDQLPCWFLTSRDWIGLIKKTAKNHGSPFFSWQDALRDYTQPMNRLHLQFYPTRRAARIACAIFCSLLISGSVILRAQSNTAPKFAVSFPAERSNVALDGRVLLLLSTDPSAEPRMQIDNSPRSQMVFGVEVDGLQPGKPAIVDGAANGYPVASLRDVKPGEYTVQAVLHRYETFHRADGKTV